MTTQQGQRSNAPLQQSQGNNRFSWRKLLLILYILFTLANIAIGLWAIFNNLDPVKLLQFTLIIILPFWAGLFGGLQILPPSSPTINLQTSSTNISTISINQIPPLTASLVGQQSINIAKCILKKLRQPTNTAIALTGIAGIGKSTLAALVNEHYLNSKNPMTMIRRLFVAKPMWLRIKDSYTFANMALTLFQYIGEPFPPYFHNLDPNDQVSVVINVLKKAKKKRLLILDQFDTWLEWKTGYALSTHPQVDLWLDAINGQKFKCKFLLTTRIRPHIRPQGTSSSVQAYMREYVARRLGTIEGVELLRKVDGNVGDSVLSRIVETCDGHVGALVSLVSLLENEPTLSFNTTRCTQCWIEIIADNFFRPLFQQFNHQEWDLLLNFAVYRTPVPLQVALNASSLVTDEIWNALNVLLRQHLLKKSQNDHYCLHPILSNCILYRWFEVDKRALQVAHDQAASYYQRLSCPPQGQRHREEDILPRIEAIWHLFHAGRSEDAYILMQNEDIQNDLRSLGDIIHLLELDELFPTR
jgi:hypothetical protein